MKNLNYNKENKIINEDDVEYQGIEWFKENKYEYLSGYDISPDSKNSERGNFKKVILEGRLLDALKKINKEIPIKTINQSINEIINPSISDLFICNREIHSWMTFLSSPKPFV